MGALCSGKSENPASLEPPKTNAKNQHNQVIGIPKVQYSGKTTGELPGAILRKESYEDGVTVQSNGKLEMIDNKVVKNIKAEDYNKSAINGTPDQHSTPQTDAKADARKHQEE